VHRLALLQLPLRLAAPRWLSLNPFLTKLRFLLCLWDRAAMTPPLALLNLSLPLQLVRKLRQHHSSQRLTLRLLTLYAELLRVGLLCSLPLYLGSQQRAR
jgi:hypothetical protein